MADFVTSISRIKDRLYMIFKIQIMSGSREFSRQIDKFALELQHLKTFWMYTKHWKDADKDHLLYDDYSLLSDMEAAVSKILDEISHATKELRSMARVNGSLLLSLWSTIEVFRPRIKEAYDCIIKQYSFQSNSNSPMSCCNLWKFCGRLVFNLQGLMHQGCILISKEQLKALTRNVKSIQDFMEYVADQCPENRAKKDLLTHLGYGIIHVAHFSYSCCVDDQMDEDIEKAFQKGMFMIYDLQKKLIANTPEVTNMYLKVLEASMAQMCLGGPQTSNSSTFWGSRKSVVNSYLDRLEPSSCRDLQTSNSTTLQEILENMVDCFLNILMPFLDQIPQPFSALGTQSSKQQARAQKISMRKDGVKTFRQGLRFLVMFLINALNLRKEDLEPVMIDIRNVVIEVGSLYYPLMEKQIDEVDLELFGLLERVELLKAETMFLELLNQKGSMILVKDQMDSLRDGLAFMGAFLGQFGVTESCELICLQIQVVAMEASSLCYSFQAKEVTEEMVKNGLFNLLDKIKLFKLGIFLRKLVNTKSSLMVPLKDQIETLYKGLIFLRMFLVGPRDEDGKLILPRAQSVARKAASFYCSLHDSKITEELASKMELLIPDLLKDIMLVKVDISEIYQQVQSSFRSNFPRSYRLGFLDFLLGNLRNLMSSRAFSSEINQNSWAESIFFVKYHVQLIYNEIKILRSFFKHMVGEFNEQSELKDLVLHVMNVTYESEYLIDSFVVKDGVLWYHIIWLSDVIEEIKLIKIRVSRIFAMSSANTSRTDELLVDLPDQAQQLVNRLKGGLRQRDVVSVVGMPGIGKTTMARKLYTEASIIYHFQIRVWCCISQIYEKRKLLIDILSSINIEHVDISLVSDEHLQQELYQCLKGKRYLIVMDDMRSIKAWYDIERSLPNDRNGSRILITSHLHDVALSAQGHRSPHHIRLFTDDESWTLLQKKVFHIENCPQELLKVGKQIAKGCKGLPLAVVIIAGLLQRSNNEEDRWKQVADNLNAFIVDDPQTRCMNILELSYKHLPDHLKACFLYLGVFVEGKEIPVRQLKWLWIAEGFIQNTTPKTLEDVAEDYLMDLIDRSLVMVVKRRSRGKGVKICNLHSIIRDFCLSRSREENFLELNNRYDELFASSSELRHGVDVSSFLLNSITYEKRRLSICSKREHFVTLRPSGPCVRSLLFFATSDLYTRRPYDVSFISGNFKLLRVLDLECINMGHSFPTRIELLVHLRYLSLSGDVDSVPSSITNLRNLETFLLKGLKGKVILPDTIWRMARLRHIHVNCHTALSLPEDLLEGSFQLGNLVTFSSPSLSRGRDAEKIMRMLPKLRRLRCIFSLSQGYRNELPVLDFLTELESLNIFCSGWFSYQSKFNLPSNLKKLTLSNFHMPWNLLSDIGRLPNLEVLKLLSRAFQGTTWDMTEGEFLKLKFLKLDTLDIAYWNASCQHLPSLEHLVLHSCRHLMEVPPDFVKMSTLQMIEMKFCANSAEESVRRLKKEQLKRGMEDLKVVINQNVQI